MRGPAAWEARQAPGDCCPAAGRRNCWAWSVLPLRPASVGAAVYCPVLGVRPLVRHTSQQNLSTDTDTLHVDGAFPGVSSPTGVVGSHRTQALFPRAQTLRASARPRRLLLSHGNCWGRKPAGSPHTAGGPVREGSYVPPLSLTYAHRTLYMYGVRIGRNCIPPRGSCLLRLLASLPAAIITPCS